MADADTDTARRVLLLKAVNESGSFGSALHLTVSAGDAPRVSYDVETIGVDAEGRISPLKVAWQRGQVGFSHAQLQPVQAAGSAPAKRWHSLTPLPASLHLDTATVRRSAYARVLR